MKAKDIMRTEFVSVDSSATVAEVVRKLVQSRRGFAIITTNQTPVGIVTEWDFLEKLVDKGLDPSTTKVSELMNSPIVGCDKETPTEEVVEMMVKRGIRRMVITDGDKVVGTITSRDILNIFKKYVDEVSSVIARFASTPF
ncbi:MAG: CBS domain-containing protein [Candidatus Marsarchaeota archaeon]|nr:CBS domain-containing protein [Candidatus Marsarchaeota archaeon]